MGNNKIYPNTQEYYYYFKKMISHLSLSEDNFKSCVSFIEEIIDSKDIVKTANKHNIYKTPLTPLKEFKDLSDEDIIYHQKKIKALILKTTFKNQLLQLKSNPFFDKQEKKILFSKIIGSIMNFYEHNQDEFFINELKNMDNELNVEFLLQFVDFNQDKKPSLKLEKLIIKILEDEQLVNYKQFSILQFVNKILESPLFHKSSSNFKKYFKEKTIYLLENDFEEYEKDFFPIKIDLFFSLNSLVNSSPEEIEIILNKTEQFFNTLSTENLNQKAIKILPFLIKLVQSPNIVDYNYSKKVLKILSENQINITLFLEELVGKKFNKKRLFELFSIEEPYSSLLGDINIKEFNKYFLSVKEDLKVELFELAFKDINLMNELYTNYPESFNLFCDLFKKHNLKEEDGVLINYKGLNLNVDGLDKKSDKFKEEYIKNYLLIATSEVEIYDNNFNSLLEKNYETIGKIFFENKNKDWDNPLLKVKKGLLDSYVSLNKLEPYKKQRYENVTTNKIPEFWI